MAIYLGPLLVITNLKGKMIMPIMLAPLNEEVRVVKILANEKIKKHLESLGILVNSKLTVISSVNGGVVVVIGNGRLALDHEVASKILVA